jgi:hypothetical protein
LPGEINGALMRTVHELFQLRLIQLNAFDDGRGVVGDLDRESLRDNLIDFIKASECLMDQRTWFASLVMSSIFAPELRPLIASAFGEVVSRAPDVAGSRLVLAAQLLAKSIPVEFWRGIGARLVWMLTEELINVIIPVEIFDEISGQIITTIADIARAGFDDAIRQAARTTFRKHLTKPHTHRPDQVLAVARYMIIVPEALREINVDLVRKLYEQGFATATDSVRCRILTELRRVITTGTTSEAIDIWRPIGPFMQQIVLQDIADAVKTAAVKLVLSAMNATRACDWIEAATAEEVVSRGTEDEGLLDEFQDEIETLVCLLGREVPQQPESGSCSESSDDENGFRE